jgi:hypothetical protein
MYLGKRYIASAAVEYCIEVRLTDCAIRRSQSFLSSLLSSRRFLGVFAIHVEVIWMASEVSSRVTLSIFLLIVTRSVGVRLLVEQVADDGGFE